MSEKGVLDQLNSIKARLDTLLEEAKSSEDPATGVKEAGSLLKTLSDLPVTFDLLRASGAGITANNIKKDWNNPGLRKQAKGLIKQWRKFCGIDEDKPKKEQKQPTPESSTSTKRKRKDKKDPDAASKPKKDESVKEAKKKSVAEDEHIDAASSGSGSEDSGNARELSMEDSIRHKCRDLLYNAIIGNGDLPEGSTSDPRHLAEELERCIYEDMKRDAGQKYRWRVNSRMSNLKDSRNPALRVMFLTGEITPEKLATMSAEEMACDELKSLRAKFTQEGISKALLVTSSGTKSDLLQCGKCYGRNCSYNQFQTRGSDEPITTFAFCNTCGNRWKF